MPAIKKTDTLTNVKIENPGKFSFTDEFGHNCGANFPLFFIQRAWYAGCNFEKEADGFGKGLGTQGDWSGIRDSSEEATAALFTKAVAYAFPRK